MKSLRHDFLTFFISEKDDFMDVDNLIQDLGIKI